MRDGGGFGDAFDRVQGGGDGLSQREPDWKAKADLDFAPVGAAQDGDRLFAATRNCEDGEAVADELDALAGHGAEVDEDVGALGGGDGDALDGDGRAEQSLVGADLMESGLLASEKRKKRPLAAFMRRKR